MRQRFTVENQSAPCKTGSLVWCSMRSGKGSVRGLDVVMALRPSAPARGGEKVAV